jgi:hypothetical protein
MIKKNNLHVILKGTAEIRGNKKKWNISAVLCENWIIRETGNVILEVGPIKKIV